MDPGTLFDYLYVNANMGALEDFDPTTAVQLWMTKKNRRAKSSPKAEEQEWFHGVFKAASEKKIKEYNPIIEF